MIVALVGDIDRLPWWAAWLADPLTWMLAGIGLLGLARWLWHLGRDGRHRG